MYAKTGKLDSEEFAALNAIQNGFTNEKISIRLMQELSCEGLIVLEYTFAQSKLTDKGVKALEAYKDRA
jgi:predicted transcriptional regulator